jgi:hypothetical protein
VPVQVNIMGDERKIVWNGIEKGEIETIDY